MPLDKAHITKSQGPPDLVLVVVLPPVLFAARCLQRQQLLPLQAARSHRAVHLHYASPAKKQEQQEVRQVMRTCYANMEFDLSDKLCIHM